MDRAHEVNENLVYIGYLEQSQRIKKHVCVTMNNLSSYSPASIEARSWSIRGGAGGRISIPSGISTFTVSRL